MNWMQNPNFRLGLYVAIAGTTAIMATDGFSAKAVAGVLLQMFVAAKAFASDPNQYAVAPAPEKPSQSQGA